MTRKLKPSANSEAGFTLLELIAVLALLALATGLAMPRLSAARQNLKLKAAAVQLVSGLKLARAAALKSNQDQALVVDVKARRYWADGAVPPKSWPGDIAVAFEVAGAEAAGPRGGFRFRPDGTASGGKLKLSSGTDAALINVDWLTGNIRLTWR